MKTNYAISLTLLSPMLLSVIAGCVSMNDASASGNLPKVQELVQGGADVNRSSECSSPLVLAAEKGHLKVISYLLEHRADPNLRLPICYGRHPILGRNRRSGHTALYWSSSVEASRLLLDKGADPNLPGTREYPGGYVYIELPIVRAFQARNLEMAELLLSRGATPNVYDRKTGKNSLRETVGYITKKDAALGQRFGSLLDRHKARDLDVSADRQRATDGPVMKSYRNRRTGAVTVMSEDLAQRLYDTPQNFAEITKDGKEGAYFHYMEFDWVDNGQNMYEWMILRKLHKKAGS